MSSVGQIDMQAFELRPLWKELWIFTPAEWISRAGPANLGLTPVPGTRSARPLAEDGVIADIRRSRSRHRPPATTPA